jgi:uncharacterized protein (DUF488 family)
MGAPLTLWTVGHSNVPFEALLDALRSADIRLLFDVRMYPQSRRHPQFNRDRLSRALAEAGIEYRHAPSLGGRRRPAEDSLNRGLRDEGFRGFADYMQTPDFDAALAEVIEAAADARTAIMCAESVPWRCHRSLISDALTARGSAVRHIIGAQQREHALTTAARVEGERVTYPALL